MLIWTILGLKLIEKFSLSYIGIIILLAVNLYFFYGYISTVSRIIFYREKLMIVTALFSKIIYISEIVNVKISDVKLSSSIKLKFQLLNKLFPFSCNFIVMDKTNFGNYKKTLKEIEKLFDSYGISHTKRMDIWIAIKQKMGSKTFKQK